MKIFLSVWRISEHKANTILIKLEDSQRKAILRIRGKEKYEFIIKPYRNNTFLVEAQTTITHEENAANWLFSGIQNIVPFFIINLTSSVVAGSKDFSAFVTRQNFYAETRRCKGEVY